MFGNQQSSRIQTQAQRRRRALSKLFVALACVTSIWAITPASIAAAAQSPGGRPTVRADFARTGTSDLVIGTPAYTLNGVEHEGVVQVVYGGKHGRRTQTLFPLDPHTHGGFGSAIAVGDINGDGYPDLIVSSFPTDGPASPDVKGSVAVFFGGRNGLSQENSVLLTQNAVDPADHGTFVGFGYGLAVGDFNRDGFADIAIGAHHWPGVATQTGAVFIVPGGPHGPVPSAARLIYEGTPGLGGQEGINQFFGYGMAAGDFNGDGFTGLAISAPGDDQVVPGQVFLLRGSSAGLVPAGTVLGDGAPWTSSV
ncbi:MAG TPA: hypothetical protein VEK34_13080 [Methylocella sp.]|nr:hypothetical protein [Methylocella sp.]